MIDPLIKFFKIIVVPKGKTANIQCNKCHKKIPNKETFMSFINGDNLCIHCHQNMQLFLLKLFCDDELR